jgi:hypothetical protein
VKFAAGIAPAALAVALASPVWSQDSPGKWGGFIDLEAKPGTARTLGEADLFVPIAQDERTLLFANVKARLDDNDSKEGNFGAGVRHMLGSGWNLGLYGYFDRRRSEHDNLFNQLTFGVEALGEDFDLRVNTYRPIGRRVKLVEGLNTADMSGASVIFKGGEERALEGFDAEAGWRVPVFEAGGPLDLRLYAGGYTFDDDTVDAVTGPRLRAEFTAYEVPGLWDGARITLGAEWQNDEARGSQGFLSARLRIPLQPEKERSRTLTAQERRMTAPIQRDVDIVAQAGAYGAPETATQTAGSQSLTVITADDGDGTLTDELAAAGDNSTVILTGTFNVTSNTTLRPGQTVMGAGSLIVMSPSGRSATLATPGATISGSVISNSAGMVAMANDSTLAGMTVINTYSGMFAQGVWANSVTGARILDNSITAIQTGNGAAQGIIVYGTSSNVTVSGNTVTARRTAAPADNAWAVAVYGTGGAHAGALVTGNTLSASGSALQNRAVYLTQANILPGSSGNTAVAGSCGVGTAGIGSTVTFTNAPACGP